MSTSNTIGTIAHAIRDVRSLERHMSTKHLDELMDRCSALSEQLIHLKSKLAIQRAELETLECDFKLAQGPPQCPDKLPEQAPAIETQPAPSTATTNPSTDNQGMLLQGGVQNRVCGNLKKQFEKTPPDLILLFPYNGKSGFKTFPWFGQATVHRVNLQDQGPDALWKEDQLNTWYEAWELGRKALDKGQTVACACVMGKNRSLTMAHALCPTNENVPWHEPMLALARCKNREEMLALAPVDSNTKKAGKKRVHETVPLPGVESISGTDSEEMSGEEETVEDNDANETEQKAKKPRKDPLVEFGSHERVLTHYMHLDAGFTLEKDEENKLQVITPKRTKSNELKSFRARLGKHLRAIGFVCVEDDDEKTEEGAQFAKMDLNEHAWVRPTVDADGKNVALNEHTLESIVDKTATQDEQAVVDPFSLA
jgi:hypothetical protein